MRRLSFDLIGLPPTYAEVQAFENDRSPDAVEKVVDRLLASPLYGERWGRHWLDVARYSDTKGYVFTEERRYPFSYTYRDYVIDAFNDDLPFDRFILEQLAADQLNLKQRSQRAGGDGIFDCRPAVQQQRQRHHRRPHRRRLARIAGSVRHLRPLPRPQIRSDSDRRLLLAATESSRVPSSRPSFRCSTTFRSRPRTTIRGGIAAAARGPRPVQVDQARRDAGALPQEAAAYLQAAWHEPARSGRRSQSGRTSTRLRPLLVRRWSLYLKRMMDSPDAVFVAWRDFAQTAAERIRRPRARSGRQAQGDADDRRQPRKELNADQCRGPRCVRA